MLVALNATKYVIITDVTARLNSAAALARFSIYQLTYNFHGTQWTYSVPWYLCSEPRCIQPPIHVTVQVLYYYLWLEIVFLVKCKLTNSLDTEFYVHVTSSNAEN